ISTAGSLRPEHTPRVAESHRGLTSDGVLPPHGHLHSPTQASVDASLKSLEVAPADRVELDEEELDSPWPVLFDPTGLNLHGGLEVRDPLAFYA
ncbi:unnamed protein product, partial [Chrysoparadoxa australica]